MDGHPSSLYSGSPPLLRLNSAARRPSPLHSYAPSLLWLDPTVRRPSPLCSSAPSLLRLGPMDRRPSSLRFDLILRLTVPHCFAQVLSLFSGLVLHGKGASKVGDGQELAMGVHGDSNQRRGVLLGGCDEGVGAVPPPFVLEEVSGSVREGYVVVWGVVVGYINATVRGDDVGGEDPRGATEAGSS